MTTENKAAVLSNDGDAAKRAHNFDSATRRILTKAISPEKLEAASNVARSRGYDLSKQENQDQVELMVEVADATREVEEQGRLRQESESRKQKAKAASTVLTASLKELGYDPNSYEAKVLGNHLFSKHGVEDANRFSKKEFIEEEIEKLTSSLSKKKAADQVTEAIINKGTDGGVSSESRTVDADKANKEVTKNFAQERGLSETKAKKIIEQEKNIPSRWRRK